MKLNESIQYLKRDGFSLGYTVRGNGLPCFVIGSAIHYPKTFPKNLEDSLQFVFMDQRAFASSNSKPESKDFTLEKILADIDELRRFLNLDKIIILGHSIHSFFALEYAKKYPTHVSSVILIANSPFAGATLFQEADRYFQESVSPERKNALGYNLSTMDAEIQKNPERAFIIRMIKFAPMIWYDWNYDSSSLWENINLNSTGAEIIWGSMFSEYDITQNLENLHSPIFLALGRYDYWNPPHLWEKYRTYFPKMRIRIFEKSGHNPQMEEAELFSQELKNFLDQK